MAYFFDRLGFSLRTTHRIVSALCLMAGTYTVAADDRPNIIVFLADDLGYGDLACYGSDIVKSPRIDAFATQGARFTQAYAAGAVCSPSRAGLLTGRSPWRSGIYGWLPGSGPAHLQSTEITVATLLRNSGYATSHFGKWHVNSEFNSKTQPQPHDHGFDWWFATQNNAEPSHKNPANFVRNGVVLGPLDGYSAPLTVEEAIEWLRTRRPDGKPFYLQVWTHEPHTPLASAPEFLAQYSDLAKTDELQAIRCANITQLDFAFGQLMDTLDELGLTENSLVVFASDNGPVPADTRQQIPAGDTGGLRGTKSTVYEGGIRVPTIIRWPGHIVPGSVATTPIIGSDFFPTFCAIAGLDIPGDRTIDGTNLLPIFDGGGIARQKPMYWRHNRGPKLKLALRDGDWKILSDPTFTTFALYNLASDPAETQDRSKNSAHAQRLAQMTTALKAMDAEILAESQNLWPSFRTGDLVFDTPIAPDQLSVQNPSSNGLTLSWNDRSVDEGGFEISRSDDGANFVPLTTVGSNIRQFQDFGLPSASRKYYRVRAINSKGASPWSAIASGTTSTTDEVVPLPYQESFGNAVAANLRADSGTWTIQENRLIGTQPGTPTSWATIWLNAKEPIGAHFNLHSKIRGRTKTGLERNAFVVFDYSGPTDFKYAGIARDSEEWIIGERVAGANTVLTRVPGDLSSDVDYPVVLEVRDRLVTIKSGGQIKASHQFTQSVFDGRVGWAVNNGTMEIDDIHVDLIDPYDPSRFSVRLDPTFDGSLVEGSASLDVDLGSPTDGSTVTEIEVIENGEVIQRLTEAPWIVRLDAEGNEGSRRIYLRVRNSNNGIVTSNPIEVTTLRQILQNFGISPDGQWLATSFRRRNDLHYSFLGSENLKTWTTLVPNGTSVIEEVIDNDLDGDGKVDLINVRLRVGANSPRFIRVLVNP